MAVDLQDSQMQSTIKANILNHFTEVGFNPSYYYSRESSIIWHLEVLSRLDTVGAAKFDRDVAEQIFQQCPQRNLGDVMIEDFAENYAAGIVISRQRISKLSADIEEDKRRLQRYRMMTDDVNERDKALPAGNGDLTR